MMRRGAHPAVGFGQVEAVAPVVQATSPWGLAVATSVIGAATGWCIEELAKKIRKRKRRR